MVFLQKPCYSKAVPVLRMKHMKATVDRDECIGCELCVTLLLNPVLYGRDNPVDYEINYRNSERMGVNIG